MNNKLIFKTIFIGLVVVWACYTVYPNFVWYSQPLTVRQEESKRKNPMAKDVIPLGLDLQGGVHLVYQIDTSKLPDVSDETVRKAVEQNKVVIENRIDAIGVANAVVQPQGREFLLIQMPGVFESEEAKRIIGKTALLEFRLVRDNDALIKIVDAIKEKKLLPDQVLTKLPDDIKKMIPPGLALLPHREGGYLLADAKAALTGKYLKSARVEVGTGAQVMGLSIGFQLDDEGSKLFEALTGSNINERLAIVLDGLIQSAPVIQSRISDSGQITGNFTAQEAKVLANVLNSGNLQAPMTVVEERSIGPELGEDSIKSGLLSMLIGFGLVVLFMVIYYKVSGFLADIALFLNLLFLFAAMALIKANMTLPGIAGVILSLAMSVDANIIILERVREELRKGKQVRHAIEEGYEKASSSIIDGNVTVILAAAFLFQFGPGPVKGFGITLMIGLAISMFTCVWITKIFYDIWFSMGRPEKLSV